jgi:hypothetical protein
MRLSVLRSAVASVLLISSAAFGEIKSTVDHNAGDKATPAFKFEKVPAPTKGKPATKMTVAIVDGDKDDAGADADQVLKGDLPDNEDKPESNFFFAAGSDGGRLVFDLGSVMPVSQVNTYSWHKDTRAAQVYKLYAADGKAANFDPKPKQGTDPVKCGWTLVSTVDTRPKTGEPGGQYGVSTADSDGKLGDYRYVMMDVSKTEGDDEFGNTFYSRVDVVTGDKK